jgi:hypothetical protein
VEIELGSDDDANSVEKSNDGTPRQTSTFELSDNAKASLASALNNPDMDLAANLHASAKSCRTNFSSSTGNSTNRLVNTKQFALTHKACALALTSKCKKSADMEHANMALYSHVKELEEMLTRGGPLIVENNPHADESSTRTGISFVDQMAVDNPSPHSASKEFHDSASSDETSDSDESESDSEDRIIPPHPIKNFPVKSVPSDPSKTCLPKHKVNDDLPIPIHGGGGTTQYQPSTDNDDTGNDLPLSNQGGGFTSQYHTPQRTADELPTVEDSLVPGRQDKSKQSMPHVYTSPDLLPPGVVYVPFPPSSGRGANTYYPCPGRMSERDQVQPVPSFDPKTKKHVLRTSWRPKTKSFQAIFETIPRATPTQAKSKGQMSYCLDEIVDINRCHLHFASKTVLMCHIRHYQIIQQARVTAGYAIKELEEVLACGSPLVMENTLPANAPSTCTGISFKDLMAADIPHAHPDPKESHDYASSDGMSDSDESKSDSDDGIIPLHLSKIPPVTPAPRDPSKTHLPASKDNAGSRRALEGIIDVLYAPSNAGGIGGRGRSTTAEDLRYMHDFTHNYYVGGTNVLAAVQPANRDNSNRNHDCNNHHDQRGQRWSSVT